MKQDDWSRLSRSARWSLPPAEAWEVLADYVQMLSQPKPYYQRLAVFILFVGLAWTGASLC